MILAKLPGWAAAGIPAKRSRLRRCLVPVALIALLGLSGNLSATAAKQSSYAERMHARAVESFRQGRFPEAYGRFVELANAGHPASARYALWMCEQGIDLFGKNWDCAPHEVEDWTRLANRAMPQFAFGTHPVRSQSSAVHRP